MSWMQDVRDGTVIEVRRRCKRTGLWSLAIALGYGIGETAYFGWHLMPQSGTEMACDGIALLATMVIEMMNDLTQRREFRAKDPYDKQRIRDIRYVVGPLAILGEVDPRREDFRYWWERFCMPVKCEYVYGDGPQWDEQK